MNKYMQEASLGGEIRVSKAIYRMSSGTLFVEGWCLSKTDKFDLVLHLSNQGRYVQIQPNTKLRQDVRSKHPEYPDQNAGWMVEVEVPFASLDTTARVAYIAAGSRKWHDKPIDIEAGTPILEQETASPAEADLPALEKITIRECTYNNLRNLITIKADCPANLTDKLVMITSNKGRNVENAQISRRFNLRKDKTEIILIFPCTGVTDGEKLILTLPESGLFSAPFEIIEKQESATRAQSLQSSVSTDSFESDRSLNIESLIRLRFLGLGLRKEPKAGHVCYFPEFDASADLSNHFHRASWYLGGESSDTVESVTFGLQGISADVTAPDESFDAASLVPPATFHMVKAGVAYLDALENAQLILVWRPISKSLLSHMRSMFKGAIILPVATEDPTSVEYGNYVKLQWLLLPKEAREGILQQSQERLRSAFAAARAQGLSSATIFGTGPSLDSAFDFNFETTLTIACNTIVASPELLEHIRPRFLTAGDAVSHFGVSSYAGRYRRDLATALLKYEAYFLTTASTGYLLMQRHPEIADRVILCEQTHRGPNTNLENIWSLPKMDSTLNIHMLPLAMSFADTVYLLGFDGKNPNADKNEDFWAHSQRAHYHDLVETGHSCHPTFALNRAVGTEGRYNASTEESMAAAECLGKRFYSLADSFNASLHARFLLPNRHVRDRNGRMVPDFVSAGRTDDPRALIIMKSPRAHFSGGRYHASLMALAMAEFCGEVVVWSNNVIPWLSDININTNAERLTFLANDFIEAPKGNFEFVIFVPDLPDEVCKTGLEIAQANKAKTGIINFESPNWFNSMSPEPRDLREFTRWYALACFMDVVFCSAETAVPFAEEFYHNPFRKSVFFALPPAINSSAVATVMAVLPQKERQIAVFGRFGSHSRHKNLTGILDMLPDGLEGYTLTLVAGTSDQKSEEEVQELSERLQEKGIQLRLLHMTSDRRKLEELAKSDLLLFPTLFEGFGYPPVEAAHVRTPTIMFDLPVLKEFHSDHGYFAPTGDTEAIRRLIREVLDMPEEARFPASLPAVCAKTQVRAFSEGIRKAFETAPQPCASTMYKQGMFNEALDHYTEGLKHQMPSLGASTNETLQQAISYYLHNLQRAEALVSTMMSRKARNIADHI